MATVSESPTTRKPAPRKPRAHRTKTSAALLTPAPRVIGPCPECGPALPPALAAKAPMSSTVVITWAECLVCHAEGLARPEHNGRCKECWEFYRRTGTDRTSEELERTKGLSVDEICSKGLLRQRSTTADPSLPRKVRTPRTSKRTKKIPTAAATPALSPTKTSALRKGHQAVLGTVAEVADVRPIRTCSNCGKRFYGRDRDGRCGVCFTYRKQHGVDRQHTHPTPDIIVGAPTLGQGRVRYARTAS
jgi:hypothetical protein